jgi:hypothetical protein
MNKIEFPRVSFDGTVKERKEHEGWFYEKIGPNIVERLNAIQGNTTKEQRCLGFIKNNLLNLILCKPQKMEQLASIVDTYFGDVFCRESNNVRVSTDFGMKILNAFNYKNYRKSAVLLELAQRLNVMSCPYCNMAFTLFVMERKKRLAKFQFDHFFSKLEYPFLSMSLYNLIPSCPVCNQSKSTGHLSLKFHPYVSSIADQFIFKVTKPVGLFLGAKKDDIEIEIVKNGNVKDEELDFYNRTFHIKALYQRHRDIAQEVFDKAYQETYYRSNPFTFINDMSYRRRLTYGVYMDESEIEKRPMSKFIQDICKQALGAQ